MIEQAKKGLAPQVVIMDPPRAGCEDVFLTALVTMAPERIIYISCNPETQARDLKKLTAGGYLVNVIQPVDMFPGTKHVETVVLLSQRKADDYIEVELELDGLNVTSAESKATYKEIQEYVLKEHGLKVSKTRVWNYDGCSSAGQTI